MFRKHILFNADAGNGGGNPPPAPPPAAPPPAPGGPPPAGDGQPGPVPYDRFKEVNDQLAALRKQQADAEAAQKTARDKELADQAKWQQLAEQKDNELKAERAARLRLEVAARKGIPVHMADRLRGDTAEDLEKDADELLKFLKPQEGPGVPPAGKGGEPKPFDLAKMTPEEIRKNKDKILKQ